MCFLEGFLPGRAIIPYDPLKSPLIGLTMEVKRPTSHPGKQIVDSRGEPTARDEICSPRVDLSQQDSGKVSVSGIPRSRV